MRIAGLTFHLPSSCFLHNSKPWLVTAGKVSFLPPPAKQLPPSLSADSYYRAQDTNSSVRAVVGLFEGTPKANLA